MNPWEYLNYSCNQSYILWSGLSICNQWHQAVSTENCWFWKVCFAHILGSNGLSQTFAEEHFWQPGQNCPSVTLGWYTRAGTLQDRTCWRRFVTHHHQARSPTTRFVQTRNICQDRETGVDRCFAGAFQFSKRKSALYSFFPRGGGEFKVVNSTQQLGAYYMMLCGCFSVYQAGKYTPRYDSRGVCVHVFVVVVGIGEYYCDHPIDHLTNSHPILERWIGNWHQKHANLSHEGNLITMPYAKDEGVGCGDGERL